MLLKLMLAIVAIGSGGCVNSNALLAAHEDDGLVGDGDLLQPPPTAADDMATADLTPNPGDLALAPADLAHPVVPSCAGLASTCGPSKNDDCCETPLIPGGMFFRSFDVAGDTSSGDLNFPATVNDFRLDRYEVTVGRFRQFVAAVRAGWHPQDGMGGHPKIPNSGWNNDKTSWPFDANAYVDTPCGANGSPTWSDTPGEHDAMPMNCVDWYTAFAFCTWDGGWLPTEAEWDYAAGGGDEQRAYPWSQPPSSTTIDASRAVYNCPSPCTGLAIISAVGATSPLGDGRWGQSDLSGNMSEWVLDRWSDPIAIDPCDNCTVLSGSTDAVLKGGSYALGASDARVAARTHYNAKDGRFESNGFRCAREP